jgi:DNA-binding SARP family transcriptional activator
MADFDVRMFGRFRILRDGCELGTPQRLAATAFKMLVLHGGTLHGELLARHLWPDQPQATRHARLRNVLSRTRQQTGVRIARRGDSITLVDTVRCDLAEFLHESPRILAGADELLRRRGMELQSLWVGPPLEDHRYEPWADEYRGRAFRLRTRLWEVLADPDRHGQPSQRERQPLPAR